MLSYAPFETTEPRVSPTVLAAQPSPALVIPHPNVVVKTPQTVIECNYIVMAFIVCVILLVLQDSRSI
jgi:hypothetical protein